MQFELTETQQLLKDTADRLVREQYDFETRKKILESPDGYSKEIWSAFAELGLLGIEIDEEFGGSGGAFEDLCVVCDPFGRALVVEPFLSTVVLGAGLIQAAGAQAQKAALLPGIADGSRQVALAAGEAKSRYSLSHVETRAVAADGGYVLNGQKSLVLGGPSANTLIVSARTSGNASDANGISLFLVDAGAPGVSQRGYTNVDGRRASEVTLANVRVSADALLGPKDGALALLTAAQERAIVALCNDVTGTMAQLNELTLDYIKTRKQFGQPIGKFQVLQHRMVDMTIAHEGARSVTLFATQAMAGEAGERAKAVAAAKVQVGRSAQVVGRGSIQLHGGIGMTMEYSASHFFRRLTAFESMFGDIAHHLARFSDAA